MRQTGNEVRVERDEAELSSDAVNNIRLISSSNLPTTKEAQGDAGQQPRSQRALSASGSLLLKLEQEEPRWAFNMCGALVLSERLSKSTLVALLKERLVIYRRYRSLITKQSGWRTDTYTLEDLGADYDPEQNVIVVEEEMREWDDLARYGEKICQRPFRAGIPPWEMHLIRNFQESKSCLVGRFSHSLGDGFTVVQIILALTDNDPQGTKVEKREANAASTEGRARGGGTLIVRQVLDKAVFAARVLWNTPYALYISNGVSGILEPRSLLRFKDLGSEYTVRFSRPVSVDVLKQTIRPLGATVNDAVVAILSGAARRYLEAKNAPVPKWVTTAITFNSRGTSLNAPFHESSIGNKSMFLYLPTLLDPSPQVRMLNTKRSVDRLKASPLMIFAGVIIRLMDMIVAYIGVRAIMGTVLFILRRFGTDFPLGGTTLNLTNVPGPSRPLLLSGIKVEGLQAFVSAMNVFTVFSYNGDLRISYTADAKNLDADLMVRCVDEEVDAFLKKGS